MSAIRSKNTKPEMVVRKFLHARGFRYRLHRADLPGKPDLVLSRHRTAIFVDGCFWHGHACARNPKAPATNTSYWGPKIARTQQRDREADRALAAQGWQVIRLWECELNDDALDRLVRVIRENGSVEEPPS
jgi:DNA mismatch endonuclease (patch repair protein)